MKQAMNAWESCPEKNDPKLAFMHGFVAGAHFSPHSQAIKGQILAMARAIAANGFGRPWNDFLPVNANDTDQLDLIEYATAALESILTLKIECSDCGKQLWDDTELHAADCVMREDVGS